ncbi:hypothetical protein Tco_1522761 [Tanacetum coccineum]
MISSLQFAPSTPSTRCLTAAKSPQHLVRTNLEEADVHWFGKSLRHHAKSVFECSNGTLGRRKTNSAIQSGTLKKHIDTVRWDIFIDDSLVKFWLGINGENGFQCCLHSSKGSIISMVVNHEFQSGKEVLKQGEWSESNITSLIHVLDCFIRFIQILESVFEVNSSNGHESSVKKLRGYNGRRPLAPKDNGNDEISDKGANSCWINIIKEVRRLEEKGINLLLFMKKKLGNGLSTLFWDDVWCMGSSLRIDFLELMLSENSNKLQSPDSWSLDIEPISGGYTVASSET